MGRVGGSCLPCGIVCGRYIYRSNSAVMHESKKDSGDREILPRCSRSLSPLSIVTLSSGSPLRSGLSPGYHWMDYSFLFLHLLRIQSLKICHEIHPQQLHFRLSHSLKGNQSSSLFSFVGVRRQIASALIIATRASGHREQCDWGHFLLSQLARSIWDWESRLILPRSTFSFTLLAKVAMFDM